MAKVKITKSDGQVFEVSDLTFEQVKDLLGFSSNSPLSRTHVSLNPAERGPDYEGFASAISDHAKAFFLILGQSPHGISLDHLATGMGFDTPMKIGGVTGGGIAKLAPKFGLKSADLYERYVGRKNGERVVVYKAGKDFPKLPLK